MMRESRQTQSERGIALVTAILMLALMSALLVGVTAMAVTEQRGRFQNRDRTQAFEAAHSGLEKLTNDLGDLFTLTYAPTDAQVQQLRQQMPEFPGVQYKLPGQSNGTGYQISREPQQIRTLSEGNQAGLKAYVTPYKVTVTANTASSSEVTLRRMVNTVAIPVFQFGIFSDTDLSFYPGPDFNFGGRVHTNGNLFLAKRNDGTTQLVLSQKVTAVRDVIRTNLANRFAVSSGYNGPVKVLTVPGGCGNPANSTCRPMGTDQGSLTGDLGSAKNTAWETVSKSTYGKNILNGDTGATPLALPLAGDGAKPIDLIRRAPRGEDTSGPIFGQRFYQYASLRIMLSDRPEDITELPQVSAGAPVNLATLAGVSGNPSLPAIATSNGSADFLLPNNRATITGYIKIEKQTATRGTWQDVTQAILQQGYAGRRLGGSCGEPNAGAIIRIQRLRDDYPTNNATFDSCGLRRSSSNTTRNTIDGKDYWPNVLYDVREGLMRDKAPGTPANVFLGGLMYYVELDMANLRSWLVTQSNIMDVTGFVVYFSDRRGNHDTTAGGAETGEFGFEDNVNRTDAEGTPNGGNPEVGEDVNGDRALQTYGARTNSYTPVTAFTTGVLALAQNPGWSTRLTPAQAKRNPAVLFRRALKLVNGSRSAMRAGSPLGLTVASENPVYIEGDYNANSDEANTYTQPHIACAVIADSVTMLSRSWSDKTSIENAHNKGGRVAAQTTTYRTAIIAGKSLTFDRPTNWSTGNSDDFGTDGGTHNFLRYLENWSGTTHYYLGSMVSFYYSRQATGTFKCCTMVYDPPIRRYTFDEEFLNPALLPPRTPMVRDVNTLDFSRMTSATTP